jgi:hypothetical protein
VAITAVNADPGNVMFMAERNRLLPCHADFGEIGSPNHSADNNTQRTHQDNGRHDAGLGYSVGAAMKDLRHSTASPDASSLSAMSR